MVCGHEWCEHVDGYDCPECTKRYKEFFVEYGILFSKKKLRKYIKMMGYHLPRLRVDQHKFFMAFQEVALKMLRKAMARSYQHTKWNHKSRRLHHTDM
jgi:hypothetical protein